MSTVRKKINLPYFAIRLLTVACYFLPFIFFLSTCTDAGNSREAYNITDAMANEKEKYELERHQIESFAKDTDAIGKDAAFTESIERSKELCYSSTKISELQDHAALDESATQVMFPTCFSLSGIGAIWFHKNNFDKLVLALSLCLSLVTLLLWRFLNKRRWALVVISINLGLVVIFILSGLLSHVTLLYGTWILLFLLVIQLLTEIQLNKTGRSIGT